MEFPDWSKEPAMQSLFYLMGIYELPELPPVEFIREEVVQYANSEKAEVEKLITQELTESAVDIRLDTKLTNHEGLFEYKGRKVLIYMQEQHAKWIDLELMTSKYKCHLVWCKALADKKKEGRMFRYRATRRTDGFASVYVREERGSRNYDLQMELCNDCRNQLKLRGMYPNPFSYAAFFKQFGSDESIEQARSVTKGRTLQTYIPDWDDISREYREKANWTCQACRVDLSKQKHRHLLDVHHVNRNPTDNSHRNLRVLCVDCHSKQPGHEELLEASGVEIRQIREIRKMQRKHTLSSLKKQKDPFSS